jgi:hypothetical protein
MRRAGQTRGEKAAMTKKEVPARGRSTTADPLGPNSEIARKLKQYYDELVSDEVPDRFASLLAQLDSADTARNKD